MESNIDPDIESDIQSDIEKECPICLNYITEFDGYLLLSCCNNKVHIQCLENWYNNNGKKKKICFLCQNISKDLDSIIINSPINNQNQQHNINSTIIKNIIFLFSIFIIIIIISIMIILKVF